MAFTQKRKYSRKVRYLGYGIILLEVATIVALLVAVYSMGVTGASLVQSVQSQYSNGNGFGLKNETTAGNVQYAFELRDISNKGYLPVTLSISYVFLNSQNQNITIPRTESLALAAGQTLPVYDLRLPTAASASNANGINFSFQISSIGGLLGTGFKATVTK